jgi:hypothetical protein
VQENTDRNSEYFVVQCLSLAAESTTAQESVFLLSETARELDAGFAVECSVIAMEDS